MFYSNIIFSIKKNLALKKSFIVVSELRIEVIYLVEVEMTPVSAAVVIIRVEVCVSI
jgi:hypothetical protein